VDDTPIEIDEVDLATPTLRREQSKTRRRSIAITAARADTGALRLKLFNSCHDLFVPNLKSLNVQLSLRLSNLRPLGSSLLQE
jgi:hypothetical protein